MAGPAEKLSNALPPVLVAVHAHRVIAAQNEVARAQAGLRMAQRHAAAAGVPLRAIAEARMLLVRGAAWVERRQQELFTVLSAMKCAVQVETPGMVEVTADVSAAERRADIHREGYAAAVQGGAREPHYYTDPDDRAAWLEGFDAFAADLAAFEATEQAALSARKPGRIAA